MDDFSDFEAHIVKHNDFDAEAPAPAEDTKRQKFPCKIDDLDLMRPPGFVGVVVDWIDSQCRYPRRRLAVASAIAAVGNIGGLSHEDKRDGVTANMVAFCVAASSTGKEAVMQAFNDLHRAAGVSKAIHGSIKSEQEIMRNAIEQQASYYSIDEIGIFLTKVRKAQKGSGGASYLEGVFGTIMSTYSKANSFMPLGGDVSRELRKTLLGALSRAEERGDEHAIQSAQRKLETLEQGLERPFMSIVGYTTPSTFDGVMDGETATQGLVGRALIANEPDINPRARKDFKKAPLPLQMDMRLKLLAGRTDDPDGPVEFYGDRAAVHTDEAADKLLCDLQEWLHERANDVAEETGEASVAMIRRAFEMILKVSFILGLADGVRTYDHVRWAFAYVRTEVEQKIGLVFANDNAKQRPEEALAARLLGRLDPDTGKSVAVLANQTKHTPEDVSAVLTKLEATGDARQENSARKYRGKVVLHWFKTG